MSTSDFSPLDSDDRVTAALAHISIALPNFGLLVPIFILVLQKRKSHYVTFHAAQALAFRVCLLATFSVVGRGMMVPSIKISIMNFSSIFSGTTILTSGMFERSLQIIFLLYMVLLLCYGVFLIYGIIGAVRTARGKPFRYLVIGNIIQRLMQKNTPYPDSARPGEG